MEHKKTITVAVHDGVFHADDVFAVAILKLIFPKIKVVRTREESLLKKADMRIDVGMVYNPKTNDFDHHQKSGAGMRANKIPYASVGLIWKHFGKRIVNSSEAFDRIDEKIIQPIDALDNGLDMSSGGLLRPYTVDDILEAFLPYWNDKNKDFEKAFLKAVEFAVFILKKEVRTVKDIENIRNLVEEKVRNTSEEYIIFENKPPNCIEILLKYPKIKFVLYRNSDGNWFSEAARVRKNSFEMRNPFPEIWAGLDKGDLIKVTKVKDAVFCHKNLFIVGARSKEGAVRLTQLALKN